MTTLGEFQSLPAEEKERASNAVREFLSNLPPGEIDELEPIDFGWAPDGCPTLRTAKAFYAMRQGSAWRFEHLGGQTFKISQFREWSLIETYIGDGTEFPSDGDE